MEPSEKLIQKYHKKMSKRGGVYTLPVDVQAGISAWNRLGSQRRMLR
jgi:hypothetical protein|tara:strand:+ start:913 stop:1053 length:141 start_codon:yes stop_codon:yes gene_type:complete